MNTTIDQFRLRTLAESIRLQAESSTAQRDFALEAAVVEVSRNEAAFDNGITGHVDVPEASSPEYPLSPDFDDISAGSDDTGPQTEFPFTTVSYTPAYHGPQAPNHSSDVAEPVSPHTQSVAPDEAPSAPSVSSTDTLPPHCYPLLLNDLELADGIAGFDAHETVIPRQVVQMQLSEASPPGPARGPSSPLHRSSLQQQLEQTQESFDPDSPAAIKRWASNTSEHTAENLANEYQSLLSLDQAVRFSVSPDSPSPDTSTRPPSFSGFSFQQPQHASTLPHARRRSSSVPDTASQHTMRRLAQREVHGPLRRRSSVPHNPEKQAAARSDSLAVEKRRMTLLADRLGQRGIFFR